MTKKQQAARRSEAARKANVTRKARAAFMARYPKTWACAFHLMGDYTLESVQLGPSPRKATWKPSTLAAVKAHLNRPGLYSTMAFACNIR